MTNTACQIDHLIHVYKRGAAPFRSLSALPDGEATEIMAGLYVEGSVFWERFKDPAQYLHLRRQIEQWLHQEFIARGGAPRQAYPIYMVLGRSKWLRTALDPATAATTVELEVPLALFGQGEVSFTYPDSMVSWLLAQHKDPKYYLPDYHGRIFTLAEIRALVQAQGLPGERWGANLPGHLPNYIEAQVWNQAPLLAYWGQLEQSKGPDGA